MTCEHQINFFGHTCLQNSLQLTNSLNHSYNNTAFYIYRTPEIIELLIFRGTDGSNGVCVCLLFTFWDVKHSFLYLKISLENTDTSKKFESKVDYLIKFVFPRVQMFWPPR